MSMALSVSYRVTDYLSIGVGMLPRIDTFTSTVGNYLELDKMINLLDSDSGMRLNLKTQTQAYAEYVVGILFRPPVRGRTDRLSLGITYQREISGFYGTGPSTDDVVLIDPGTGDKYLIFPIDAFVVDFIGYNPAQVSAGLALKPWSGLNLATDITWSQVT